MSRAIQLEETNRAHEHRCPAMFDQAPAGVAIMGTDGTVTHANAALCRLLDRDEADLLGLTLPELGHPADLDRHGEELEGVLAGRLDGLHGQRRLLRADGSVLYVAISAALVRDETGRPEQFVAQMIDITALIHSQHPPRDSAEQYGFPVSVFDNTLVGMTIDGPDGRLLQVNRAMCDLLGYDAHQLTARSWDDITHPDDIGRSGDLIRSCLAGEIPGFSMDKRLLHADGHEVTVALVTTLVRDEAGQPLHLATQLTDIQKRRTLQEQLRGQHHQYARLLEGFSALGEGVVVDDDGRIVYANGALCGLTGYDRDELMAMNTVEEFIVSTETEETRALADGGSRGVLNLRRRNGSVVPAEFATMPIRLDGHVGTLTIVRDLSETLRCNAELAEAHQFKTDLLAMLSHDIGQPLTGILGYSRVLMHRWDGMADEVRLKMLGQVCTSAERLGEMVSQILAVGQVEGRALRAEPEPVPLAAAVEYMLAFLSDSVPGARATEVTDAEALVDPSQLQQILTNLVANAGKYGRPPIEVTAREFGDGQIELRVRDHGEGVPPAFVPHLFDRYSRGRTTDAAGTGLGLFIVRRLAEANGGEVHYDASVSPGACFVLRLPVAPAA